MPRECFRAASWSKRRPDHDTIANFRKRLGELEGLFKQVLEIAGHAAAGTGEPGWDEDAGEREQAQSDELGACEQAGAAVGGGGKEAASWRSKRTRRRRLSSRSWTSRKSCSARGTAGSDPGSEGEDRRARARAVRGGASGVRSEAEATAGTRRRLKVGGKPPKEPEAGPKDDQVNFTDEESRIMPGANGDFIQGYNAQAVVEQDSHMVVATHVARHDPRGGGSGRGTGGGARAARAARAHHRGRRTRHVLPGQRPGRLSAAANPPGGRRTVHAPPARRLSAQAAISGHRRRRAGSAGSAGASGAEFSGAAGQGKGNKTRPAAVPTGPAQRAGGNSPARQGNKTRPAAAPTGPAQRAGGNSPAPQGNNTRPAVAPTGPAQRAGGDSPAPPPEPPR